MTATNGLDAPVPYTAYTVIETASTSKTVTLVAVLKALRQRGISVDSPVSPYLPANWSRGAGMNTVTFRQLLSHGMKPAAGNGMFKPDDCDPDFYGCLRDAVAVGMTQPAGYDNIHYAVFRVILPFVLDPPGRGRNCSRPRAARRCSTSASARCSRTRCAACCAQAGVTADFAYPSGSNTAYRYIWGTPPTNERAPTGSEDDYLRAGPGGLKMSSRESAQFLSRAEKGELLSTADLATAKAIGFGEDRAPKNGPSGVGPHRCKNGGAGGAATQAMVFPGVEVFISHNSTGNAAQTSNETMLIQAWQAALVNAGD